MPLILVGDSLGMVMLGYEETVRVTMDEMLHHTKAVVRGTRRSLVIGDMPFMSYGVNVEHVARERRAASSARAARRRSRSRAACVRARTIEAIARAGHPGDGPHRPDAAVGPWPRRPSRAGQDDRIGPPPARRCARSPGVGRLRGRAGAGAGRAGRSDHRAPEDPDHRHRCRRRLLRPGPGDHRSARPDLRLHSRARRASTRTSPSACPRRSSRTPTKSLRGLSPPPSTPRRWTPRCSPRSSARARWIAPTTPRCRRADPARPRPQPPRGSQLWRRAGTFLFQGNAQALAAAFPSPSGPGSSAALTVFAYHGEIACPALPTSGTDASSGQGVALKENPAG